jgi:ABC-2 type transport system ATP-binding protein
MSDVVTKPVLEMQSVVKSFDGKLALNRLNFNVNLGQVIGLLGRNGAGKSTLIECALGLRAISAGEVKLFDESPFDLSQATRGRIGYVPQQTDLFGWMTALQMLAFFKAFYQRWNQDKANALLDRWSIPATTLISKLSGGEKQRLAIIRALAHEPDLLMLDEPVASLDPAGRRDFLRELVESVITRDATVLFSTHILTDLERIAIEVAFMRQGKVLLQENMDTLSEEAVMLTGSVADLSALSTYILSNIKLSHEVQSVAARIPMSLQASVRLAHPAVDIAQLPLEDFFIEVTA